MRTGYTEAELTGFGKVKKQRLEIDQALASLQQPGSSSMEMFFMIDQRREQRREEREDAERKRLEEREEAERKRLEDREDKLEQQRREDRQFQMQFLAALMGNNKK